MTCNQWSKLLHPQCLSNWRKDKPPFCSWKGLISPLHLSCLHISFFSWSDFQLILPCLWTHYPLWAPMAAWGKRGEVMKDKEGKWLEGRDKCDPFLMAMPAEEGHENMTLVLSRCWWLQTHKVSCWAALVFVLLLVNVDHHWASWCSTYSRLLQCSGLELLEWAVCSCFWQTVVL